MESSSTNKHRTRAKLIFNPGLGATGESTVQLMDVIRAMQAWKLVPVAYLVEPGCDLPAVVRNDLEDGIRLFVLCGGYLGCRRHPVQISGKQDAPGDLVALSKSLPVRSQP